MGVDPKHSSGGRLHGLEGLQGLERGGGGGGKGARGRVSLLYVRCCWVWLCAFPGIGCVFLPSFPSVCATCALLLGFASCLPALWLSLCCTCNFLGCGFSRWPCGTFAAACRCPLPRLAPCMCPRLFRSTLRLPAFLRAFGGGVSAVVFGLVFACPVRRERRPGW